MRVLNVGGGASRSISTSFDGWDQDLLDIDQNVNPDIVLDAKEMKTLPSSTYDGVFCSHTLEHFYKHEVPVVLEGFLHVLKDDGFAEIIVPSLTKMIEAMNSSRLDLTDVWYRTSAGTPITFHDVLYGWNYAIENGNQFYAHKCGWTPQSLGEALVKAGFKGGVQIWEDNTNIFARAFKKEK